MPDPFAITMLLLIAAGVLAAIVRRLEHEEPLEEEPLEENWTWPSK